MLLRFFFTSFIIVAFPAHAAQFQHALSLYDEAPKYAADFAHFDYVNPDAPRGGSLRQATVGTFDSLNPFILKGNAAAGMGLVYEPLMTQSLDEPFTMYPRLAESVSIADDRTQVTFRLNPNARWHDGKPVTAADVVWTTNTLKEKGHPFYRSYYSSIQNVEAVDEKTVRFTVDDPNNRELPLTIAQMSVLPRHDWETRAFDETTLQHPIGSGPYRVSKAEAGRSITFQRVQDWWGEDLPTTRGMYNFDSITYDYYRDYDIAMQAFLGGDSDIRIENVARNWATAYNTPAVKSGQIIKQEIPHEIPTGMQAFAMNLRRPLFQDIRVRAALNLAFDFEWSNRQFAYDSYARSNSYFSNSELAAHGLPSENEIALLEPYRDQLLPEVFHAAYRAPVTDGSGNNRANMARAAELLKQAGWTPDASGVLSKDGMTFRFEILIQSPSFERWILPFIRNLKRLGIQANLRLVDSAQYQARMDAFDYDMTIASFPQSNSPGNEQRDFLQSSNANVPGSRNVLGIQNDVVDALVEKIIGARSRTELITATRALDRVLLWNHYVIPQWHIDSFRLAYWKKLKHPLVMPKYDLAIEEIWWASEVPVNQQTSEFTDSSSGRNRR